MREMTCIQCGKVYDSPRGRKTCSESCRKAHQYENNKRRTPEHDRVGAIVKCSMCGTIFTRTGAGQKYCTTRCQARSQGRHTRAKAKVVPAKCCICGQDFMTSQSASARTCGMPCTLKLRSQLAKARAAEQKQALKDNRLFSMPCPWESHKLDTLPPGVTSWSDPIMDPMSGGFPMRTFSVPSAAREVAA